MTDNRPVVANLDFDTLKQDMIDFFRTREEFKDYEFTGSALNLLMDILAYNTHYNSLAANFLVNEMFLDSALLRTNVVSIAKALNYTPRSARAAMSTVTMNVPKPLDGSLTSTIPAGSLFTSMSGNRSLNFYTLQDYVVQFAITDTVKTVDVEIFEGNIVTQRFYHNDLTEEFPAFEMINQNVDTSTMIVTVNGTKYDRITPEREGIADVNKDSLIYFVEEGRGQTNRVIFGNGAVGNKLEVGDEIIISFIVTNGPQGNGISTFSPNIPGTEGARMTINGNPSVSSGGDNPETIREIKDNAPHWYAAQYRAVTEKDYEVLLKANYADIQSVHVYGGEEVGRPGNVFFSIKPKSGERLSEAAKQTISNDILNKYNVVTVTPVVIDPQIVRIVVKAIVQYDGSSLQSTPGNVRARIFNLFRTFNTSYIGKFLENYHNSNMTAEIANVDDSIVSSNVRISLRFDVTARNTLLDYPEWEFGNKLYHPFDGYKGSTGGILSTNLFQRLGSSVMSGFDEDGYGNIRLYDFVDQTKVIVNAQAGTIDYTTGRVKINAFDPTDSIIEFTVVPDSFDVIARTNTILEIATDDSSVRVIDMNDTAALSSVNLTRSE